MHEITTYHGVANLALSRRKTGLGRLIHKKLGYAAQLQLGCPLNCSLIARRLEVGPLSHTLPREWPVIRAYGSGKPA
jgi:hypothetical protein